MGRHSYIPTLFDDCKTISISKLSEWGYLKPSSIKSGSITWTRQGERTGSISISIYLDIDPPFIQLDYKANNEPIKYNIGLVSVPANIGNGIIWYFICPKTGKRCRKLHLVDNYFHHRSAWPGCLYEKQTWSKNTRLLAKTIYKELLDEHLYEEIYSKHFKKYYRGKLTKRHWGLLKKLQ